MFRDYTKFFLPTSWTSRFQCLVCPLVCVQFYLLFFFGAVFVCLHHIPDLPLALSIVYTAPTLCTWLCLFRLRMWQCASSQMSSCNITATFLKALGNLCRSVSVFAEHLYFFTWVVFHLIWIHAWFHACVCTAAAISYCTCPQLKLSSMLIAVTAMAVNAFHGHKPLAELKWHWVNLLFLNSFSMDLIHWYLKLYYVKFRFLVQQHTVTYLFNLRKRSQLIVVKSQTVIYRRSCNVSNAHTKSSWLKCAIA